MTSHPVSFGRRAVFDTLEMMCTRFMDPTLPFQIVYVDSIPTNVSSMDN